MNYIKYLIFTLIVLIFEITLPHQVVFPDNIFMALAIDNYFKSFSLNKSNMQNQTLQFMYNNNDKNSLTYTEEQTEEINKCPPKPSHPSIALEKTNTTIEKNAKPLPIRIIVPTIANTGASLLIEGSGFIPFEQVRIELSVDWFSSLPELKDKTIIYCKMVEANNIGNINTMINLPSTPQDNTTTGIGKYSIIGIDSLEEKTALATFISSKTQMYGTSENVFIP